jgi:hypothetical protein
MRKAMATVMVAGTLLAGLATASPALAVEGGHPAVLTQH